MTTVTMEMTKLEQWKLKWKNFYNEELEKFLSFKEFSAEKRKTGVKFLNDIDKNIDIVLNDLHRISDAFSTICLEQIVFHGAKNLFGEGFEYRKCLGKDLGIVKYYNEKQHLIFDPFVLETEMKAEFIAPSETDDDERYFFLTINLYEEAPKEIYFDFEYSTPEHIELTEQFQNLLKNSPLKPMDDEDEIEDDEYEDDDENMEANEEALKLLSEMKFNQLKNSLRWQNAFDSIQLQKRVDDNGEIYYLIQIMDKTISFTTVKCDKKGWNIHWGSSTPSEFKTLIQKVMENI